jgi:CheY-specific phosphatase CheX
MTRDDLTLANGSTYYVSSRALDNVGNVSESAVSDGVTIDTDVPVISSVAEGSMEEDIDFQNNDSTLIISWSGSDDASGVSTYEYALGTTSGETDIVDWATNGTATADTLSGLNLTENQTYYLSVRATDIAGNVSDIMTGDGILIDMTGPVVESILDGSGNDLIYTGSDSSLTANWSDFRDLVSGVAGYEISVNDGNVYPWTWIGNISSHTIAGLDLEHGGFYTVNIRGTDNAGNLSETSSSDGILVDTEPPGSILNIVDDYYNEAGWDESVQIQGTAADGNMQSGLSIVEVAIQDTSDNTYWSGNDWTSGEQWLQAQGLDSLSYGLSANQLADEHIYRVRSRSTDAVGNTQSDYGEDIFTYDITEPNTTLDIPDDYYNDANWDAVTHIQGTAGDATSGSALVSVLIQRDLDNLYYGSDGWVDTVQWQLAQDTENWLYDFSSSNLDNDVTYSIQVRAEDVAGNVETSFASDNFTYDITPPSSDVLIERSFYNNINWSDANSISGIASDSTSGTSSISISILRNSDNYWWGGTNWTSSENWLAPDGVASWTYGLNGNNLTNGVSYTISSRGEDIAGNIQAEYGQDAFIYDLTAPVVGQVNDGALATDQDWSSSTTEMSANWSNFSDVTSGIVGYEYSIGSSPAGTDVLFWTENGTDTTFTEIVPLNSGDIYYVSVRATDGAENVSNVQSTDGVTIDAVNPTVGDILEGSTEQDYDYQQNSTSLTISWAGSDALRSFRNGRDLSAFSVSLGTDSAATDVVDWVNVSNVNSYTFSDLNLQEAVTYYANVKALDLAGNESEVVSGDGITIDQSGPIPGSISDGDAADIDWVNINYLSVGNWTGFTDSLSGIGEYEYSLGLAPGQTQVVSWTSANLDTAITVSASLTEGPTYYANVRAVDSVSNVGGLISSDGFGLDVSAPITGNVYDGLGDDLTWTNITDSIWANWEGFSDLYSGISFYETAVGTSPGGQNTVSWVSADTNITTTHAELSLEHGSTYYFSVRATDVVENVSSPGTSNGITIDTLSPVINLMAEASSEDPLFQGSDSSITLLWAANDDLSGIEHYDYALGSSAGETDLLSWTNAGTDLSITIGDLILEEGSKYYGSIRVYDQAGNMTEAHGNGVTVDITAPGTGSGLDITDLDNSSDQSFTGSLTTLQASWSGFTDNLSGIDTYEYGVGSASLSTDIKDWTTVNLDTFMLDNSFSLNNGDTYYISIRAIDSVGNISAGISTDGIIADHEGPYGSMATDGDSTDIDQQNDTDIIDGYWSKFQDNLSGLAFYSMALYDTTNAFYTVPWDSIGLDTVIQLTGLNLEVNHVYQLHIRATDFVENTGSIIASDGVLIDQTAPAAPVSLVGFFSNERIYLTWDSNAEADLSHYSVYGGTDTLQPLNILLTSETTAEAYLPEFPTDEPVYLHVTAEDIPGNESPVSIWVSGIPQQAMVTHIEPDPSIPLLKDDQQISIHFSQPLSDIGSIATTSLAYASMNFEATYSAEDTSIKITINDPWASLDTVVFALNDILDWAGTGTDEKTATFTTYLLGDYNNDYSVDVSDLSSFVSAWNSDDYSYELGPVTGTVPHLIPSRNEIYDLRDVMAFTRMWHYSHQTSVAKIFVYDPLGSELNIYQEGHRLVVDLPEKTRAAHLSVNYPRESKTITPPAEINSSEIIQLAYHPEEQGQLIVEKAFLKKDGVKNASFNIASLNRENAIIEINYVAYDDSNRVIGRGTKILDIIAIPDEFALHQNYPNPFNPTTMINYDMPENGKIKMVIYDLMGREVTTLINNEQNAGYHNILWNGLNQGGRAVSAGIYFCRLSGNNYNQTIKMLLLK